MAMDFEELPLLHFTDLAAAVLKASSRRAASLGDAAVLVDEQLALAHERPPASQAELLAHLGGALDHLLVARLVEVQEGARFRITPRGRAVLSAHSDGIDDTVLIGFPEFRAWMNAQGAGQRREDTRPREYQRGYAAFAESQDITDNPYRPETAQYQAWENGWYEARDCRSRLYLVNFPPEG
jgi:ribosome modulation factor